MHRLWLLSLVVLLGGCARNAILEVQIDLPPGATTRYAFVQFETSDADFETVWGRTTEYPGTPLSAARQEVDYSVVTESASTQLRAKVSFCTTPDCSGIDDAPDRVPAVWYELPRAFYIGQRTTWRLSIPTVPIDPPTMPTTVDRCSIAGCVAAPETVTNFCRLDGRHFCE